MDLSPQQTPSLVPPVQPETKNNTTRIILIIVAVVAGLCLVSCIVGFLIFQRIGKTVSNSVQSNPQDVTSAIEKIASFEIPAGFSPGTSLSILGMTFAVYEGQGKDTTLVIFQMPAAMEITDANIKQMEDQLEKQYGQRLQNAKIIEQRDEIIRGEPGKVILQEGEVSGTTYRQMVVIFQGKGGLAMMYILGPANGWDQAAYDQMVKSIK